MLNIRDQGWTAHCTSSNFVPMRDMERFVWHSEKAQAKNVYRSQRFQKFSSDHEKSRGFTKIWKTIVIKMMQIWGLQSKPFNGQLVEFNVSEETIRSHLLQLWKARKLSKWVPHNLILVRPTNLLGGHITLVKSGAFFYHKLPKHHWTQIKF